MTNPTLAAVATEMAEYVERSDVTVAVDTRFPWVDIEDNKDPDNAYHLDGDAAEEFLAEADRLYEEAEDISRHVAYYATAKQYIEAWS